MSSAVPSQFHVGHQHEHPHVNSVHHHPHFLHLREFLILAACALVCAGAIGAMLWVFLKPTPSPHKWAKDTDPSGNTVA